MLFGRDFLYLGLIYVLVKSTKCTLRRDSAWRKTNTYIGDAVKKRYLAASSNSRWYSFAISSIVLEVDLYFS